MDNDFIYRAFVAASKQIAEDLEITSEISYDREEWEPGYFYEAKAEKGNKKFEFWLRDEKEERHNEVTACLSIDYLEEAVPYYFQEEIDYIVGHSNYLSRWAAWAVFSFNQIHKKINLDTIFHESIIQVYGTPGYGDPAESEANFLFHGMLAVQKGKVIIYRFRHVDPPSGYLCRSISYAIWVCSDSHSFWVVIPDSCGLDSGGGFSTYRKIESLISLIKEKLQVAIRNVDIPYCELESYLINHCEGFSPEKNTLQLPSKGDGKIEEDTDLFNFDCYNGLQYGLKGLDKQFERMKQCLKNKEYPEALRDLRAMVQQAEEDLVKEKGLDISSIQEPDVNKLASVLIDKKIIDGRLRSWFGAFTTVANLASHKHYPTAENMKNEVVRTRIMLTFQIGFQLLEELDNPLSEEIVLNKPTVKADEPKV